MSEKKTVVTRTIWLTKCVCGFRKEYVFDPPREVLCPNCKKFWMIPTKESYTGPELKEKK